MLLRETRRIVQWHRPFIIQAALFVFIFFVSQLLRDNQNPAMFVHLIIMLHFSPSTHARLVRTLLSSYRGTNEYLHRWR